MSSELQQRENTRSTKVPRNKYNRRFPKEDIDPILRISDKSKDTFFYTAIRNHVNLGDLADKKANLLLVVSALIFSFLIAKVFFQITTIDNQYYIIPFTILIISSVITVILAILVTRPKVTEGTFDKEDLKNNEVNLAFFGNFHSMSFKEFNWAVVEMLKDNKDIYSTLTMDLYFLGKVLNRKYVILNAAYIVFMTGFALAIITAIVIVKT